MVGKFKKILKLHMNNKITNTKPTINMHTIIYKISTLKQVI